MPKCVKCGIEFEGDGTVCMNCRRSEGTGTEIDISEASEIETNIDDTPTEIKQCPQKRKAKEVKDFVDKE